jgi:hypothetical protein
MISSYRKVCPNVLPALVCTELRHGAARGRMVGREAMKEREGWWGLAQNSLLSSQIEGEKLKVFIRSYVALFYQIVINT